MFNRMGNAHNHHQGIMPRILCVCSAGLLRSPTLAWVLSNPPYNCNTRAVGVSEEYALIPIELVHLEWADAIFCMDDDQAKYIRSVMEKGKTVGKRTYTVGNPKKPIYVLNLADCYGTRSPELVEEINKLLEYENYLDKLAKL